MAKLKDMSTENKTFFVTTMTSMLAILKIKFTDTEIKTLLSKKNIDEVLKMINEINEDK